MLNTRTAASRVGRSVPMRPNESEGENPEDGSDGQLRNAGSRHLAPRVRNSKVRSMMRRSIRRL